MFECRNQLDDGSAAGSVDFVRFANTDRLYKHRGSMYIPYV